VGFGEPGLFSGLYVDVGDIEVNQGVSGDEEVREGSLEL
jgi:hypothetical protein